MAREVEQLRARNRQLVKDLDIANAKSRANHVSNTAAEKICEEADLKGGSDEGAGQGQVDSQRSGRLDGSSPGARISGG